MANSFLENPEAVWNETKSCSFRYLAYWKLIQSMIGASEGLLLVLENDVKPHGLSDVELSGLKNNLDDVRKKSAMAVELAEKFLSDKKEY